MKTQEAESAPANLFSASADTLSLLSMNAERKLKYFPWMQDKLNVRRSENNKT